MELVRGLHNLRAQHRDCVLTIGAFDGIHRGHQEMIRLVRERAGEHGSRAALLSFEPTPREFFAKGDPPPRLTRFREKVEALQAFGIERFVCARFDARLRSMQPHVFIEQVLVDALAIRHLVVGHDFRFACNLAGDVNTLRAAGTKFGFGVTEVAPFEVDAERVSSSIIREALGRGDLARATRLLGRPYRMTGKVIHGGKLGRSLGYPTANLRLHRRVSPVMGVFAVRVSGGPFQGAAGVANLGTRPAVDGRDVLLEVHVFDFAGDLYRQHLHVDFIARLRDERWFPTLDALVEQMDRDAARARQLLEADRG